MELRIARTRIRIHPLMLLMLPLACRLGLKTQVICLVIALGMHETAHLAAAACMRIPVPELTLMPFGGSARIGNPYVLSPGQLALTAAAGPAANLILVLTSASFAHWSLIDPGQAVHFIKVNALLMLFNLMPALPLDGGRILYAIVHRRMGNKKALETGIWLGRLLALLLILWTTYLFMTRKVFNLSYVFAAVFLIASASGERRALSHSGVHTLISALSPITAPMPVSLYAVDASCTARTALRTARPGCINLYAVYENGVLNGFTDDRSLLDLCLASGSNASVLQADRRISPHKKTPPGGSP